MLALNELLVANLRQDFAWWTSDYPRDFTFQLFLRRIFIQLVHYLHLKFCSFFPLTFFCVYTVVCNFNVYNTEGAFDIVLSPYRIFCIFTMRFEQWNVFFFAEKVKMMLKISHNNNHHLNNAPITKIPKG
jgi:hypothetical protein